jgi:hypothetical protein
MMFIEISYNVLGLGASNGFSEREVSFCCAIHLLFNYSFYRDAVITQR